MILTTPARFIQQIIILRHHHTALRFLGYSAKGPSSPTATWKRAAVRVKTTDKETNNPYLDLIRDTHDPSMHIKTIEEELQSSIGKALGKQGQKIILYMQLMHQDYQKYESLLLQQRQVAEDDWQTIQKELTKTALAYNQHRKHAIQARWELMVHRQAAGMIVNNHQHVIEHYPIAKALPTENDRVITSPEEESEKTKEKKFGDQLDWWQRVGRWK